MRNFWYFLSLSRTYFLTSITIVDHAPSNIKEKSVYSLKLSYGFILCRYETITDRPREIEF